MKNILSLLAVLSLGSAGFVQAQIVLQTYDLNRFDMTVDLECMQAFVLKSPSNAYDSLAAGANHANEPTGHDYVLDVLESVLGDSLGGDGVNLDLRGDGVLAVRGPAGLQANVSSTLDLLYATVGAAFDVQVDLVRWDGAPQVGGLPASTMSVVVADAFLSKARKNGADVRSSSALAYPGKTLRMEQLRLRSYLADYDVEIAMASAIADPVVRFLRLGEFISMRLDPAPGGAWLCLTQDSYELLGMTRAPVKIGRNVSSVAQPVQGSSPFILGGIPATQPGPESDGPSFIEAPQVMQCSMGAETFIPDGQVVCCSVSSQIAGVTRTQVLMIRLKPTSMPVKDWVEIPAGPGGKLVAINLNRIAPASLDFEVLNGVEHPFLTEGLLVQSGNSALEWAIEQVSDCVGRATWIGAWAFAHVDPSWNADSSAQLDALRGLATERTLRDVHVTAGGALGRIEARLPVDARGQFGLSLGLVEAFVWDYDVEVAQGTSIADPAVIQEFSGVVLAGQLNGTDLRTQGFVQWREGDRSSIEVSGGEVGAIESGAKVRCSLDRRSRVSAVGVGALGDSQAVKAVEFGDKRVDGAHATVVVR